MAIVGPPVVVVLESGANMANERDTDLGQRIRENACASGVQHRERISIISILAREYAW